MDLRKIPQGLKEHRNLLVYIKEPLSSMMNTESHPYIQYLLPLPERH